VSSPLGSSKTPIPLRKFRKDIPERELSECLI
jgi:hypothetical protein